MLEVKKRLLFINMEYTQDEVNEPINVDILLQSFPKELFDETNVSLIYRDLLEIFPVKVECYDIILISTKISSFPQLVDILKLCRDKIVILGGILAICAADELINVYPNVVFNTGEGETNIEELLRLAYVSQSVKDFKQLIIKYGIPNISFFDENKKGIYNTKRKVCDLSIQEYHGHNKVLDVIAQNGLVRMETSRGCPWNKCSFCIMPWKYCNEKWRQFSYMKIEKEIEHLIESRTSQILFTDEDFVGNYTHIMELCSIIERVSTKCGKKISLGGSTSVLTLLKLGDDLDICLQRMHDVGISFLFIGIESGCNSQLMRFNKGVSVSENEKLIHKLQQFKFQIDFGFIMFDADTTMNELEQNLDFIERTGLINSISRFAKRLRVTPHTRCYQEYKARGLVTSKLDVNELLYEYKFADPLIDLICDYIEKMDSQILAESYHLQYVIRSTDTLEQKSLAHNRLMFLRKCGYVFLRKCIEIYKKNGTISPAEISGVYNACLGQGGDIFGDN